MPQYAFRAADNHGSLSQGAQQAEGEGELYAVLQKRGLTLIECREKKISTGLFANKILLPEQVLFCRHLLALVRAGVPAHVALKDVVDISKNRALQKALNEISTAVMQGASLSSAFDQQGERFDTLFSLLLRAGERTGKLTEALGYLHEALSWKNSYTTKLKRMMMYPIVQITLACSATLVLMLVAVPQIIQLLGFLGQELPWYSKVLLGAVNFAGFAAAATLISGFIAALFLPMLRVTNSKLAISIDSMVLRLPLVGTLLSKQALARLAQLFAAMLASGIGMNEALAALPQLTRNKAMAYELQKVRDAVASGQGFSAAFERSMHLPGYMVRLLKVGEDGGELSTSLRHIAQLYQEESEQAMEAILKGSSLGVTIIVGFVLAAIVMGVIYPLYNSLGSVMGQ